MIDFLKESCVESLSEAILAEKNGANLIELCADLANEGLTPKAKLIKDVQENISIPIKVMIRPRKGNFQYSENDVKAIQKDIKTALELGINEIVFGATKDGNLDIELIKQVAHWAKPMQITIHKAIDTVAKPIEDIKKLLKISNITSILTSGQQNTAFEGIEMLKLMKEACGDRITIIPAGKVTHENVESLHKILNLKHYHGRKIVDLNK